MDKFYQNSVEDAARSALDIAQEIEKDGEYGAAAKSAMERHYADLLETNINSEWAYKPSLWERIGDLFYDLKDRLTGRAIDDPDEEEDPLMNSLFARQIPLLNTHPIEDLPLSYDEAEAQLDQTAEAIGAMITERTGWQPLAITPNTPPEGDEWYDDDPSDLVRLALTLPSKTPQLLMITDGLESDPKLLGYALYMVYLSGAEAEDMIARLTSA